MHRTNEYSNYVRIGRTIIYRIKSELITRHEVNGTDNNKTGTQTCETPHYTDPMSTL